MEVLYVVLIPFVIGYLYGKNNVDPNTIEGRAYYWQDE